MILLWLLFVLLVFLHTSNICFCKSELLLTTSKTKLVKILIQIYQIISGTVKAGKPELNCPEFKPFILESSETYPHLLNYQENAYLKYQQQISELMDYQPRPALPAAFFAPGSSVAGGSRHTKKYRNHNHKNTHTRKHSRTHSTKHTRTTRRRLHNRIDNKKHNTSQKR